ncbi:MAG: hypothetical protein U5R31_09400 [Acidimicrobiia bacterium]|nr:hypothetical protein [Acidimicrobiia bacterium]
MAGRMGRATSGRLVRVLGVLAVMGLVTAGCGGDGDDDGGDGDAATTTAGATADTNATDGTLVVSTADTDHGEILVDDDGDALYAFLDDEGQDTPTCVDACADAWPPVIAENIETSGELNASFNLIERPSGEQQVTANGWPLYLFADDEPGEALGQGAADKWFVLDPDGELVDAPVDTTGTTTVD